MDQPKLKNVYDKNRKLIQVLYSICNVWQSLYDYMLRHKTYIFNWFLSFNEFPIFIIHVFDLRLVNENQISTLFPQTFSLWLRFEYCTVYCTTVLYSVIVNQEETPVLVHDDVNAVREESARNK